MLRGLRRRYQGLRDEPLARFTITITAVCPFPEEPEDNEAYRPSLLVAVDPLADGKVLSTQQLTVLTLLFVEWALIQVGEEALLPRLRTLVPRLRVAVGLGKLGPEQLVSHRASQQERYYHHREAATYTVALHRDAGGLYIAAKERVVAGRWTGAATLLEAATLAPYEALLQLESPAGLVMLAWLERAIRHWRDGRVAAFPVGDWDLTTPILEPDAP